MLQYSDVARELKRGMRRGGKTLVYHASMWWRNRLHMEKKINKAGGGGVA